MEIDLTETLRRGIARHQAGDLDAASAAYEEILTVAPGHADALHLKGLVAYQRGDHEAAVSSISKAIDMDGNVALYHANLGRVLRAFGDNAGAVDAFRHAVQIEPDTAGLHADMASALLGAGDADAARARANLAIEIDPNSGEAHVNLGLALQDLYGPANDDAVRAFRRAIELAPQLPGAYLGLGVALHEQGDREGATAAYVQAITLNPNFIEAHCNLGNLARDALSFDKAVGHYRRALDIDAAQPQVWGNLAVVLQETGQLDAALRAYDKAIEYAPADPDIRRNRGMALLAKGHFVEGWQDYEYRWQTTRFRKLAREWPVPAWDGSDLTGKRILVHAEQGLGDTLQFCRYLPILHKLGAVVVFECADALRPLMDTLSGASDVIAPRPDLPAVDYHAPLLSLPRLVGTTAASIPADVPYLSASQARLSAWHQVVAAMPGEKKIGIAWRGSPDHPRDAVRSPGLAPFMALLAMEGVTLVSLQKEGAANELATVPRADKVIDPTANLKDFADTAALMMQLDAIVSCDSAPLHLAGALGLPAFAVLPHVAEWRWGTEAEKTPWYPAMTLLRQPEPGDWESVFEKLAGLIATASRTS
ncbi:MAG: tetratricopeptide repeat protein [Rhodospirillales bacterium]|nr:tetratricopeptide repeat protein [Rhodospirillales bacterium]MBO6786218.1 tetratricopeptide repeat protein [Rhodospirillales bacterium]